MTKRMQNPVQDKNETHSTYLQAGLGKSSAPFRLPQSHLLFEHLSEAIGAGKLLKLEKGVE